MAITLPPIKIILITHHMRIVIVTIIMILVNRNSINNLIKIDVSKNKLINNKHN